MTVDGAADIEQKPNIMKLVQLDRIEPILKRAGSEEDRVLDDKR